MKTWVTRLTLLHAACGYDFLGRLGRIPFSGTQMIMGSYETAFGGVNIPRDSRVYNAFVHLANGPVRVAAGSITPAQTYYMSNARARKNCTETKYPITNVDELDTWTEPELDCLLRKGNAPESLATGLYYGRVESWLGSDYLREFGEAFSGGTVLAVTKCDGLCPKASGDDTDCQSRIKIGFTQTGLSASAPSFNYIGPEQITGLSLWHQDHIPGDWWWMDWSVDVKDICPSRVHRFYDTYTSPTIGDIFKRWVGAPGSSLVPAQQYTAGSLNNASQLVRDRVAQIREVGTDAELNCKLYLGRFLTLFPEGLRVTGFFTFAKLI